MIKKKNMILSLVFGGVSLFCACKALENMYSNIPLNNLPTLTVIWMVGQFFFLILTAYYIRKSIVHD